MTAYDAWGMAWPHGRLRVNPLACALEPLEFRLPDGRMVAPFHRAPWVDGTATVPPLTGGLRGEWPCLPFGYARRPAQLPPRWRDLAAVPGAEMVSEQAGFPHGLAANSHWQAIAAADVDARAYAFTFPPQSPVQRMERCIRVDPAQPSVTVSATLYARRPCRAPFAFHPTFRLPHGAGLFEIDAGPFAFGLTHPTTVEPGRSHLALDARFANLSAVPNHDGGVADYHRLPLPMPTEDIVFLAGLNSLRLLDHAEGVAYCLQWDAQLAGCVLWFSNGGRDYPPWSGRNFCLGVEPCAAPLDLGAACAAAANPLWAEGMATALDLSPDAPLTVSYSLTVAAL
jgi:hypothetical protein